MTITVRKLMAAVAVLGLVLAAFRAHLSLGSFVVRASGIAWIEAGRAARRREAAGAAVGVLAAVGLFARSLALAALILVAAMVPAVVALVLAAMTSGGRYRSPGSLPFFALMPLGLYGSIHVARGIGREPGREWAAGPPATDAGRAPADDQEAGPG